MSKQKSLTAVETAAWIKDVDSGVSQTDIAQKLRADYNEELGICYKKSQTFSGVTANPAAPAMRGGLLTRGTCANFSLNFYKW